MLHSHCFPEWSSVHRRTGNRRSKRRRLVDDLQPNRTYLIILHARFRDGWRSLTAQGCSRLLRRAQHEHDSISKCIGADRAERLTSAAIPDLIELCPPQGSYALTSSGSRASLSQGITSSALTGKKGRR
jgi:hypothetical protein